MKLIKFSVLSFGILSLFSCGNSNEDGKDAERDWKTHAENDYSIHYPDNWELDLSKKNGMSFMILSPADSDSDLVRENVNLLIQDIPDGMNMDQYIKVSESQIKSVIPGSSILKSERQLSGEAEYHKIFYTGVEGQSNYKFEQDIFLKKGKAYILTLTCEQDQFDKYQEVGDKILNSFRLQ
jgi:hypothetical protein